MGREGGNWRELGNRKGAEERGERGGEREREREATAADAEHPDVRSISREGKRETGEEQSRSPGDQEFVFWRASVRRAFPKMRGRVFSFPLITFRIVRLCYYFPDYRIAFLCFGLSFFFLSAFPHFAEGCFLFTSGKVPCGLHNLVSYWPFRPRCPIDIFIGSI